MFFFQNMEGKHYILGTGERFFWVNQPKLKFANCKGTWKFRIEPPTSTKHAEKQMVSLIITKQTTLKFHTQIG